jgi:hypothetical protein
MVCIGSKQGAISMNSNPKRPRDPKKAGVRLLQVDVAAQEPTLWRWRVSESDLEIQHGYASSRESAQIDGDNALFKLLSLGAQ